MTSEHFSENLRSLCAEYGSIAQVCRDIGFNRQQFNRYLTNAGMPSAHNLRRIARHFDVSEADLHIDPSEFDKRHIRPARTTLSPTSLVSDMFVGQAGPLRRYLGVYHAHFQTPTWPGYLIRSLVWLREQDGYVVVHNYERVVIPSKDIVQKIRYTGLAAFLGNRIYLTEIANSEDRFISSTILFPANRRQVNILKGLTTGLASGPRRAPYSSAIVWKKLPMRVTAREALTGTGVFRVHSGQIDLTVRNALKASQAEFNKDQAIP